MTNKVIFLADEFTNSSSALLQSLGNNHVLGGAEQDDFAMLTYLEDKIGPITKTKCSELKTIDPSYVYLIANFASLSEYAKSIFIQFKNYVIYEHDHKYCKTRNPGLYIDYVVPSEAQCNLEFYNSARAVFCMTKLHKEIMDLNIECNSVKLDGSFWTTEELNLIEKLSTNPKNNKYFIYGNESYHKGLAPSINKAQELNLDFDIIPNQNTREEFLTILSTYKGLMFQPLSPETCSRLAVEARMLGLHVITNAMTGAASEDWFMSEGNAYIDMFRKVLMPHSIDIITSYLKV